MMAILHFTTLVITTLFAAGAAALVRRRHGHSAIRYGAPNSGGQCASHGSILFHASNDRSMRAHAANWARLNRATFVTHTDQWRMPSCLTTRSTANRVQPTGHPVQFGDRHDHDQYTREEP